MSDLTISAIVILCTGVLIGAIFYLTVTKKRKRESELAEYCQNHGYNCLKTEEPGFTEFTVEGDSFSLRSSQVMTQDEAVSESDSWNKETIWIRRGDDSARPSFALGGIPSARGWEKLPQQVKKIAVDNLSSRTGFSLDPANAQLVKTGGKSAFLLFEQNPGESGAALERLKPLLEEWPAQFTLFIHSSPETVRIHLANYFVRDVAMLEKVLRLGAAAVGAG